MADAPTLELRIQSNADQAIKGLQKLADALNTFKQKLSNGLGVDAIVKELAPLKNAFESTFSPENVTNVTNMANALERISRAKGGALKDIAKSAKPISNMKPIDSAIAEAKAETGKIASPSATVQSVANETKAIKDRLNARNTELIIRNKEQTVRLKELDLEKKTLQAQKTQQDILKIKNKMLESTEKGTKAIDKNRMSFSALGKAADKVITPLGKVIRAFGRIAFYRVVRSILKYIGEGFKEGIGNVRAYSEAINGSFNSAMTSAEATLLKVKNSLGAALAPALEAIVPLLQTLANWFITVINLANQLIALLTGKSQWTRATDASTESLDNVKKSAGGAAKAVKNLLAGFDELNIIQSESGGGGGGGGGLVPDTTSMFEEVFTFDKKIRDLANWLKENGEDLLRIAGEIGLAIAAWRVSKVFQNFIGQLAGIGAVALTVKVVWDLVTLADKNFLQTGDVSFLVLNALTTAVGGIVTKEVVDKMLGSGMGEVTSSLTIAVSAVADIVALIGKKDVSVFDPKALAIELMTAIKGMAAGYVFFRHGGLSVSRSLKLAGATALLTVGAAVGVKAFAQAIETGDFSGENLIGVLTSSITMGGGVTIIGKKLLNLSGGKAVAGGVATAVTVLGAYVGVQAVQQAVDAGWTADSIKKTALSSIGIGLGGSLFAIMAGAPLGVAGIVGGAAAVATVGVIVAVTSILRANKDKVQWGDYKATNEQIQQYVNGQMFTVDVPTTINLINATAGNTQEADNKVLADIEQLLPEMNVLKLGINRRETYNNIATQVLGPSLDGNGGLMKDLKTDIEAKKQTVKLALSLLPVIDKNGNDQSEQLLFTSINGWSEIETELNKMGEALSDALVDPATDQLKTDLADFEKTAIEDILGTLQRVSVAISNAQTTSQALADLGIGLANMEKPSAKEAFKIYAEYRKQLAEGYSQIEYASAGTYLSQSAAYNEFARSAKTDSERAMWEQRAKEVLDSYDTFVAGINERVADKVEKGSELGKTKIIDALQKVYGNELSNIADNSKYRRHFSNAVNIFNTNGATNDIANELALGLKTALMNSLDISESEFDAYGISVGEYLSDTTKTSLCSGIADRFGLDVANAFAEAIGINVPEEVTKAIEDAQAEAIRKTKLQEADDAWGKVEEQRKEVERLRQEIQTTEENMTGADFFNTDYLTAELSEAEQALAEMTAEATAMYEALGVTPPGVDMSGVTGPLNSAKNSVHSDVESILRDFNRLNGLSFEYSTRSHGMDNETFDYVLPFADGGFVGTGDMFIARESGPELVGRIGNRTAVANNDQIVAGVASGVASGQAEQNALLRQQNDLLRQMVAKSGRVEAVPSAAWGRFIRSSSEMYANNAGV